MDLEVRHLRLVAGIADAGSMTKAATHLHLTQSAPRRRAPQILFRSLEVFEDAPRALEDAASGGRQRHPLAEPQKERRAES